MKDYIKDHEQNTNNFTIIIIRLRKHIAHRLSADYQYNNVATELADIYHFHIFPEHTPNNILSEPRFVNPPKINLKHKYDTISFRTICIYKILLKFNSLIIYLFIYYLQEGYR